MSKAHHGIAGGYKNYSWDKRKMKIHSSTRIHNNQVTRTITFKNNKIVEDKFEMKTGWFGLGKIAMFITIILVILKLTAAITVSWLVAFSPLLVWLGILIILWAIIGLCLVIIYAAGNKQQQAQMTQALKGIVEK